MQTHSRQRVQPVTDSYDVLLEDKGFLFYLTVMKSIRFTEPHVCFLSEQRRVTQALNRTT